MFFLLSEHLLTIMKITHSLEKVCLQTLFSTKSPSTCTALRQRETVRVCPVGTSPCPAHVDEVLTALITSPSVLNFTRQAVLLGLRRGRNPRVLGRVYRVHGVALSN
jgi:hypothetical protein